MKRFYPEARFGGYTDIDGTVAFYTRIRALAPAGGVILDVGCGRGAYHEDPVYLHRRVRSWMRDDGARVIGIDVDPAAAGNPAVDEFRLIEGPEWPVASESVDLAYADFVLEHVEHPNVFFAEAWRVLKPGGHLCIRTTNVTSYVGLVARFVPNRHHSRVNAVVQEGRKAEDVFPTRYRCNTALKIRRQLRRHGFDAVAYGYEAEPSYLSFSILAYALGVVHQKLAPSLIAPSLFVFATKLPQRGETPATGKPGR